MRSPGAHITINQVEYPRQKPRFAYFRKVFAVPNTAFLFAEWNAQLEADESKKHIVLLHGHGALRFSNLSVPHPSENRLIYWTDDLLGLPHPESIYEPTAQGEGPTESPDAELVEEVIRAVRDVTGK